MTIRKENLWSLHAEIQSEFPIKPSYNRFIELQPRAILALVALAKINATGTCEGISFIDSFPLKVCHPKRIASHKVT